LPALPWGICRKFAHHAWAPFVLLGSTASAGRPDRREAGLRFRGAYGGMLGEGLRPSPLQILAGHVQVPLILREVSGGRVYGASCARARPDTGDCLATAGGVFLGNGRGGAAPPLAAVQSSPGLGRRGRRGEVLRTALRLRTASRGRLSLFYAGRTLLTRQSPPMCLRRHDPAPPVVLRGR